MLREVRNDRQEMHKNTTENDFYCTFNWLVRVQYNKGVVIGQFNTVETLRFIDERKV